MFRLYRRLGWSTIPADVGAKRPPGTWKKYQEKFPTDEEIEKWTRDADEQLAGIPQIGIVTGSLSGLVVLDVDTPEGHRWLKEHGCFIPPTPTVCTSPGDGQDPHTQHHHYYFRHPGEVQIPNKTKGSWPLVGCDLRGDGGYVVAPPSMHVSGEYRYEWVFSLGPEVEVAEMPDWLKRACGILTVVKIYAEDQLPKDQLEQDELGVAQGGRNSAAARLVGHWLATGKSDAEVLALALAWNLRNAPPLPERELRAVVASIADREMRSRTARARREPPPEHSPERVPWHEERRGMLRALSAKLGINVEDIEKVTGSDPIWYLYFGNNVYASLNSQELCTNQRFNIKIFSQTGVMLPPIPNKKGEWSEICQLISNAAEWKEGSDESTVLGATRVATEDYLVSFRPEVWEESSRPPINYPFTHQGQTFVFLSHLLSYLQNNKGMKLNIRELSQQLTALKFQNHRRRLAGFDLRIWLVPDKLLPKAPAESAKGSKVVPIKRF